MDFHALQSLRRTHPAWRLLAAENAPLVVSVLHRSFLQPNLRSLPRSELASQLEDHLFQLRAQLGANAFPRTASQYLDDWAGDAQGWLRKYYPEGADEPHYDLTPATEKAIDWLIGLGQRQFIGTESRLLTVFELLRQLVAGTEVDPVVRQAELERRRAEIDAELERLKHGQVDLLEGSQIKDRFQQFAQTSRSLLSDFREVEQNFRELDRVARERIATWDGTKAELLDDIFQERDAIGDSDQGKSFTAFWDFLMSATRQEELSTLLRAVFALSPVQELAPDRRLLRIHYDWMEAGEVAQRTVARLSQQLRRYLDDQVWLENRRIMQLIRGIEQRALALRDAHPPGAVTSLDEAGPELQLPFERPLFAPPAMVRLAPTAVLEGEEVASPDLLFAQSFVDRAKLQEHIRRALQTRTQISLAELLETHPLDHGLAELLAYLSLAAEDAHARIDDGAVQALEWSEPAGTRRRATVPLVIFAR